MSETAVPTFLKAHDVATILQISRRTVYRLIDSGDLTALRFGGIRRVAIDDLAAFIKRWRTDTADELLDDLLAWESKHATDHSSICPRCAAHTIDETSEYGWCAGCTTDRQIELDAANEREKARKLRWWDEHGNDWRQQRRTQQHTNNESTSTSTDAESKSA